MTVAKLLSCGQVFAKTCDRKYNTSNRKVIHRYEY